VVKDKTKGAAATGGFLNLRRVDLVTRSDAGESRPFAYDLVEREALDAVIMAAHFRTRGERHVFLRTGLRPPLALRTIPPTHDGRLWELPAGLIDPGESPREAAAREIAEELGFEVDPGALVELGAWVFPVPAMCAERHVFFHVEVDPDSRGTPTEDGSPLESGALVQAVAVSDALALCRAGAIRDAKTELGLRRLAEMG
jgi:ADP-ribose pyrophosphatase